MNIPHWTPSVASGWATCHFAIAWAIVMTAVVFNIPFSFLLVIMWAVPKEFVFDIIIEQDTWTDSTVDFLWYIVGASFATMVLLFK